MTNNKNKRSFLSTIGLLTSFIGMAGLVLSIISLLPLNGYNIYTTIITTINLLQFEHERTNQEWKDLQLSQDAQIYLIFLLGSFLSSLFEIVLTFAACFRHQHRSVHKEYTYDRQYQKQLQQHQQQEEEEEQAVEQDYYKKNRRLSRKSWFIRIACFTLLIQVVFSLFGTHIIYKIKSDVSIIPAIIQYNTYISCAILWINYLSLTLFAFILLFASFFILIGAYNGNKPADQLQAPEVVNETSPLLIV